MSGVPTLSYSSTRTYLECPLRWKFLYVDKLPEAPRGYFSFGRSVHAVLEELVRPLLVPFARSLPGGATQRTLDHYEPVPLPRREGAVMTKEALLGAYERHWLSEGYASAEEEGRYRHLGRELLLRYYEEFVASPPTPVAVEEHLETEWEGIPVHGYVDRIDLTPAGRLEVLDYKTSRGLSQSDAQSSDQLSFYQVLVERNYAAPVESLALYDLRGGVALRVSSRSGEQLSLLQAQVGEVYDGIREGGFEPRPGRQCLRCEFRAKCPEFREVPEGERERLSALVDRFVKLRNDEVRVDRELRHVAEQLHHEAERFGLHRVPGRSGTALRRREERYTLSAEALRAILGDLPAPPARGAPDPEAVGALLRDPSVDPATRRRLRQAAGRTVRWFWELDSEGESAPPRNA